MDLTGQRFGRLEVLGVYKIADEHGKKFVYWRCKCDCGVECAVRQANLTSGGTKSCGCFRRETSKARMEGILQRARSRKKDLTGQRFGRLLVLNVYKTENVNGKNRTYWRCRCDCGTEVAIGERSLLCCGTKSCGCITKDRLVEYARKNRVDMSGQRFGKLVAIRYYPEKKHGRDSWWLCQCDCGNQMVTSRQSLIRGKTKSCGCIRNEMSTERLKKYRAEHGRTKENDGHA